MFIGGSPGSTAGGVKTSTLAILILAVSSALRGRPEVTTFGRRIDHRTVYKSAAVMTVGVTAAMAGFFALQLTQPLGSRLLVFETFSALGTVGLTIGATMQLDAVGKIIVIFLMYLGRIGPLSLLIFLSDTTRSRDWRLPEESIGVG
jgi:trk system potassium uptake protein